MDRWLDRNGVITLMAFVGGAIVASALVLWVVFLTSGDGDDEPQVVAPTATTVDIATQTPLPAAETATVAPSPTPSGSFATADDAVAAFVQDGLGGVYIGECPPVAPSGQQLTGICSIELYRSAELATFNVGPFGSEALGEVVVLPNVDGTWSLTFLDFPPLDAQITVGAVVMVFQAKDCLNFRVEASVAAEAVSCQIDGTSGRVQEGPVEADGQTWWLLEGLGWASSSFLAPVE